MMIWEIKDVLDVVQNPLINIKGCVLKPEKLINQDRSDRGFGVEIAETAGVVLMGNTRYMIYNPYKHSWINCELMKVSMASTHNKRLADHLTRTDNRKYQAIGYGIDICEDCKRCG